MTVGPSENDVPWHCRWRDKQIAMEDVNVSSLRAVAGVLNTEVGYTKYGIQVEITARLLVRADMLNDEILSEGHKAVNIEYSREGNERATINPKELLYLEVLEKVQKALRALGMNTESKERKTDNDNFNDFWAAMKEDAE